MLFGDFVELAALLFLIEICPSCLMNIIFLEAILQSRQVRHTIGYWHLKMEGVRDAGELIVTFETRRH
jgi:hypothetical protein